MILCEINEDRNCVSAFQNQDIRLALFYKIVHQLVAVPTDNILIKADSRLRSNHKYKFKIIGTSSVSYKYSFYPRTIIEWNSLLQNIAEAPSLASLSTVYVRLPTRTLVWPALCWLSAATRLRTPPPQRHTPLGGLLSIIQIQTDTQKRDFANSLDLVAQSTGKTPGEIPKQKYGATHITLGNGYSVTNYYDSIDISFYSTYLHHDAW